MRVSVCNGRFSSPSLPPFRMPLSTSLVFLIFVFTTVGTSDGINREKGSIQESSVSARGDTSLHDGGGNRLFEDKQDDLPSPTGFHLQQNVVSEEIWKIIQHWLETEEFILPSSKDNKDEEGKNDLEQGDNENEEQHDEKGKIRREISSKNIVAIPWEVGAQQRKVAQFGFRYNYDSSRVGYSKDVPEIPWLLRKILLEPIIVDLQQQLLSQGRTDIIDVSILDPESFTQCIINIYQAGDYIPWHWDHTDFGPAIVVFVFGDERPLYLRRRLITSSHHQLQERDEKISSVSSSKSSKVLNHSVGKEEDYEYFTAFPRHSSCYILSGPVRYRWEHSVRQGSGFRVSITFRSRQPLENTCQQSSSDLT